MERDDCETMTAQGWFEKWDGVRPTDDSKRWDGWYEDEITYKEFADKAWNSDTEFLFEGVGDAWDREMKADYERGRFDGILERVRKNYENGDIFPLP